MTQTSSTEFSSQKVLKSVLEMEASALLDCSKKLTNETSLLLEELFKNLITTGAGLAFIGVGKSGHIGVKLAATFSSLGLPSYFLHPTEALHGDLGRLRRGDSIVLISKSGSTEEIKKLLPFLEVSKEKTVGLIGNTNSELALECGILLDCSVEKEACVNNQAPTTSSTLALAVGDAMAVLFEHISGLSKEGFAINHPGGLLGKSLRLKVEDLMFEKSECPVLFLDQTLKEAMLLMTKIPVSGCAVLNKDGSFFGILVEGDIRRYFADGDDDLSVELKEVANSSPIFVTPDQKAYEALELMEKRERAISLLPVLKDTQFMGFLRIHDLIKEGFSLSS